MATVLVLGSIVAVLAWPVGPGPAPDSLIRGLVAYEGAPYVWGGENSCGIDCSGLVRRGYLRACVVEGLRGRPDLLRQAVAIWWCDASARDLRDGYRGRLESAPGTWRLAELPPDRCPPGTVAVTVDGIHCLASLGGGTWIEADPGQGRVIRCASTDPTVGWMQRPVVLRRWRGVAEAAR